MNRECRFMSVCEYVAAMLSAWPSVVNQNTLGANKASQNQAHGLAAAKQS